MSHLLDRLNFLTSLRKDTVSDGHGQTTIENRDWEDAYRRRWQHDKIVRSTHGVNCTGSCSWKIYVKSGIVTWETQQTDYPRTRPTCPTTSRAAARAGPVLQLVSLQRQSGEDTADAGRLMRLWREKRKTMSPDRGVDGDPKRSGKACELHPHSRQGRLRARKLGRGDRDRRRRQCLYDAQIRPRPGVRLLADPGHVDGLLRRRHALSVLLGGTCMSFYDWYCDLPPSSPADLGRTDRRSGIGDWYNAGYLLLWGSNVPQTRTPDAHFYTEARYKGTKSAVICP
jgi:nitrate reductase alpha subunit